jgi:CRISPR/Cas system type I-B associated protein Csh2 (Cas7 group RAMP superfamily)
MGSSNDSKAVLNRGTGLLVIEVRHSNPNGDPDAESEPRTLDADFDHRVQHQQVRAEGDLVDHLDDLGRLAGTCRIARGLRLVTGA